MKHIIFRSRSDSSDEEYLVELQIDHSTVKLTCSCPAGSHGQLCKHRFAFAQGLDDYLLHEEERASLQEVKDIIGHSSIFETIDQINKETAAIEQAKKRLKNLRNAAGRVMDKGFALTKT